MTVPQTQLARTRHASGEHEKAREITRSRPCAEGPWTPSSFCPASLRSVKRIEVLRSPAEEEEELT